MNDDKRFEDYEKQKLNEKLGEIEVNSLNTLSNRLIKIEERIKKLEEIMLDINIHG